MKYKTSYYFRKKSNLEKQIIYNESISYINEDFPEALKFFFGMAFISFFSTFVAAVFKISSAFVYEKSLFMEFSLSERSTTFFIILLSIFLFNTIFSTIFIVLWKLNLYPLFVYFNNFFKRTYTIKHFSKESKNLVPFLHEIGFKNDEIKNLVIENVKNFQRKSFSKVFLNRVENYYLNASKVNKNNDLNHTIDNILKTHTNTQDMVQYTNEEDIVFFETDTPTIRKAN